MDEYGVQKQNGGRAVWIGVAVVVVFVMAVGAAWLIRSTGVVTPAAGPSIGSDPLRVVVTIPPLAWAPRELTPQAEVTVLMGPGQSAHGMELTASAARALAEADVVLAVGLGLDDAVIRALEQKPREGREIVLMADCLNAAGVDTAPDTHGAADPHAWLDPLVMSAFVARVDAALGRASGGASSGRVMLQERCESLDNTYRVVLSAAPRTTIVCEHNAYGYLADRYGLTVAAVLNPLGQGEISPGDIKAVMDAMQEHRIGAIFVEPGTPARAIERIAQETGATVLTLDPMGTGDWPALMKENLDALIDGLSTSTLAPPKVNEGVAEPAVE